MKKKIFLMLTLVFMLSCLFAVSSNAAVAKYDDAPTKTTIQTLDTDIVVFDDGYSCLSAYIFKDVSKIENNYGISNALDFSYIKEKTGESYTVNDIVSIDIPEGITHVGRYAFQRNTTVKKVTIPKTVTSFGAASFENATGLEYCIFEHTEKSGLTNFQEYMFVGCTNLKAFSMPDCITTIGGAYHFSGCTNLRAVYLSKNLTTWESGGGGARGATFDDCHNVYFVNEPFVCVSQSQIPDKPTVYYFPSKLESMANQCIFRECRSLNDVLVFGEKITSAPNQYLFQNGPANKIVFLGDMTTVSTEYWGNTTHVFFANENDKDSSCVTFSGEKTAVFCNATNNTTHLTDERGSTLKAPATCVSVAIYDAKCFCGKVLGEINGTELDPNNHNFDLEKGATIDDIKYTAYDKEGVITVLCGYGCEGTDEIAAEPIFTAEGYSIREDGKALLGGYKINSEALKAYNEFNGEKLTYGIVMSNAANVVITDGEYTGGKGLMVSESNESYTTVKYVVSGFSATEQLADLNLVITLYVVDENGMSFVQNDTAYGVAEASVEGKAVNVNAITFGYIAQKTVDMDSSISNEYKEILDAIINVSNTTVTVVPPQDEEE